MINRIERPLANDHPDGSFSVHLFLHRPKTQNLRIIGQYTHNLLGLKTLSFALLLSSTKIWIKGPQIGSDMPSALGLVPKYSTARDLRSNRTTRPITTNLNASPRSNWNTFCLSHIWRCIPYAKYINNYKREGVMLNTYQQVLSSAS